MCHFDSFESICSNKFQSKYFNVKTCSSCKYNNDGSCNEAKAVVAGMPQQVNHSFSRHWLENITELHRLRILSLGYEISSKKCQPKFSQPKNLSSDLCYRQELIFNFSCGSLLFWQFVAHCLLSLVSWHGITNEKANIFTIYHFKRFLLDLAFQSLTIDFYSL